MSDGVVESFTHMTMPAGPDLAPIMDRQPVVLMKEQYAEWLTPEIDPKSFILPPLSGRFDVRQVQEVSK